MSVRALRKGHAASLRLVLVLGCLSCSLTAISISPEPLQRRDLSGPNGDSHGWMSIGQNSARRGGDDGRKKNERGLDYTPGPLLTSPASSKNSPLASTLDRVRGEEVRSLGDGSAF